MPVLARILGGRREERSLEDPNVPLDRGGDDELVRLTTDSGVKVNARSALTCSEYWRGVNLISNAVAKTSIHLIKRLDGGGKERAKDHPNYPLMRRKPNRYTNAYNFKMVTQAHALNGGNGYAYIFRDKKGEPLEILQLNPFATYPVRASGELFYITHLNGSTPAWAMPANAVGQIQQTYDPGEPRKLAAEDVLHIRGLGFDGLVGYDLIQFARESLGLSLGMRKYSSVFFKNGAHLGVVLQHPAVLDDEARNFLLRSWNRMHSGLDNAHKTVLLEEGMKAQVLAMDARKAQLADLREIEIRSIANFLGLPPHKLGDTTRTAFASLEQENQSMLDDAYDPWFSQWEYELNDKLLSEEEKDNDSHFYEFDRDEIVRVDYETQTAGLVEEVNNGIRNLDEVRAIKNLPPLPDGLGQKFRMPMNHVIIGEEPPEPTAPAPEPGNVPADPSPDAAAAARGVLDDARERIRRRIANQAERAAKKPDGFVDWVDNISLREADSIVATLHPAVHITNVVSGSKLNAHDEAISLIEGLRSELLTVAECKASELPAAVEKWAARAA